MNFQARTPTPEDAKNYIEWLKRDVRLTNADPRVYSYPTCNTIVIDKDKQPIVMNSFQIVLVVDQNFGVRAVPIMEALATHPDLSTKDLVLALVELLDAMTKVTNGLNIDEIWLQSADTRFQKLIQNKGFERVELSMVRYIIDGSPKNQAGILAAHFHHIFSLAEVSQVKEIWWQPVNDKHQEFLLALGFRPIIVPIFVKPTSKFSQQELICTTHP